MPGNGRNGTRQTKIAGERNGEAAGQKDGQGRERGTGGVTTSVGGQERARPGSVAGREAGKMLQVQEAREAGRGEGEEMAGTGKERGGDGGEVWRDKERRNSGQVKGTGQSMHGGGRRQARPGKAEENPRPAAVLTSGGSRNRSRKPLRRRLYRGGVPHISGKLTGTEKVPNTSPSTPPKRPQIPPKIPQNHPQIPLNARSSLPTSANAEYYRMVAS